MAKSFAVQHRDCEPAVPGSLSGTGSVDLRLDGATESLHHGERFPEPELGAVQRRLESEAHRGHDDSRRRHVRAQQRGSDQGRPEPSGSGDGDPAVSAVCHHRRGSIHRPRALQRAVRPAREASEPQLHLSRVRIRSPIRTTSEDARGTPAASSTSRIRATTISTRVRPTWSAGTHWWRAARRSFPGT